MESISKINVVVYFKILSSVEIVYDTTETYFDGDGLNLKLTIFNMTMQTVSTRGGVPESTLASRVVDLQGRRVADVSSMLFFAAFWRCRRNWYELVCLCLHAKGAGDIEGSQG